MTDVATIGLLQARAVAAHERVAEQSQSALNSRVLIEQTKGALAERNGISVDEAFKLMRTHARNHGQQLTARKIIDAQLNVNAQG